MKKLENQIEVILQAAQKTYQEASDKIKETNIDYNEKRQNIQTFLEEQELTKRSYTEKGNQLKAEKEQLIAQQQSLAKEIMKAELSNKTENVEKLESQLENVGSQIMKVEAKLNLYAQPENFIMSVADRESLLELITLYEKGPEEFPLREVSEMAQFLDKHIKRLEEQRELLEKEVRLYHSPYASVNAETILNLCDVHSMVSKTTQDQLSSLLKTKDKRTEKDFNNELYKVFLQWLDAQEFISLDDYVIQYCGNEKRRLEEFKEQQEQEKFERRLAMDQRNWERSQRSAF